MICPMCGNVMGDREKVCINCGYKAEQEQTVSGAEASVHDAGMAVHEAEGKASFVKGPEPSARRQDKAPSTAVFFFLDLVFMMPLVGFLMAMVFSCGVTGNDSLTNFSRARLIQVIISLLFTVLLAVAFISAGDSVAQQLQELIDNLRQLQMLY